MKRDLREYNKKYYEEKQINRKLQIRLRQKEIKENIQTYKLSIGCELCGYKKCARALHFHHKEENKQYNIGRMVTQGRSIINIMNEIKKCQLVCSNCHAELHGEESNCLSN